MKKEYEVSEHDQTVAPQKKPQTWGYGKPQESTYFLPLESPQKNLLRSNHWAIAQQVLMVFVNTEGLPRDCALERARAYAFLLVLEAKKVPVQTILSYTKYRDTRGVSVALRAAHRLYASSESFWQKVDALKSKHQ